MKTKKIISLFVSLVVLIGILTVGTVNAFAFDENGSCGKSVTYTFDSSTGTLTISGTGAMYDYKDERETPILPLSTAKKANSDDFRAPWNSSDAVKKVIVKSGVTHIGVCAFYKCTNLKSVVISSSVTTVGKGAFDECSAIAYFCYTGSGADYDKLEIKANNTALKEAAHHNYKLTSTVDATCTKNGTKTYTCSVCSSKKTVTVKAVGHHTWDEGKITTQPTFTSKGKKTYTCKVCGAKKYADVAKLGKPSIKKLTKGKKSFKVTWSKVTRIAGYQIQYSTYKSFKNSKKVKVKGYKNTSKTVKKLKSKKTYYVRVRAYKTINGKTRYSAWSAKKYIKTK